MMTWALIAGGIPAAIVIGLVFSPWGPAALALLANSRLARGVAIVGAVAWALLVAAAKIRRAGHDEALAQVDRANTAARADRERIEHAVRSLPADDVTRELEEWSK